MLVRPCELHSVRKLSITRDDLQITLHSVSTRPTGGTTSICTLSAHNDVHDISQGRTYPLECPAAA